MWVKGLDERYLATEGASVIMGDNNRAWITDYAYDDSTYWAYWHNFLGGTFTLDVDLSSVECGCTSGIYLV